jgi:hypothetical protein
LSEDTCIRIYTHIYSRMAAKIARYGSSAWFPRGSYIEAGGHIC